MLSSPNAVVLDVVMPEVDGVEVWKRLGAADERVPILIVTARDAPTDRVDALDAGADHYLVKPLELEQLLTRLRALLGRATPAEGASGDVLTFGDLELDLRAFELRRGGRRIDLTKTEFQLLELFMRNPRQVLPRSLILERVWGYDFGRNSNSLEVFIGYLRRKMEESGERRLIQTVRGIGYALREPRAPERA